MQTKSAHTEASIHELLAKRWSARALVPEKTLTQTQILSLAEAARWAPSCYGEQPWRYVFCDRATNLEAWKSAFSCLVEANRIWAKNAALLILVATKNEYTHNQKFNTWAQYDTGAASENICLQATELGLIAHQMAGVNFETAREDFNLPDDVTCMAVIAVGYQAEADSLEEEHLKEMEQAERKRAALGEHFFAGSWGTPLA